MILYEKHVVLMSLALFAVPVVARGLAHFAGKRHRLRRPKITLGFLAGRLLLALALPLFAQAAFASVGHRYLALALAGAVYGATFGDTEDFPPLAGAIFGAIGGLAAGLVFGTFAPTPESRALSVAAFAIAPLLAYRTASTTVRRRLSSAGLIQPSRRILH